MSRIIVIEIPDKYKTPSREIFQHLRKEYPDIELRLSAPFSWWRDICADRKLESILPVFPNKKLIDNIDDLIDKIRYPKSIEERK